MYHLYRRHHWAPSVYFDAPPSDKILIAAFVHQEVEDIRAEIDELKR